jgi:hypothetical protein
MFETQRNKCLLNKVLLLGKDNNHPGTAKFIAAVLLVIVDVMV